ncbi:hypothetical protein ACOSQ3_018830 [Xanthoceras sorbifolium]
MIGEHVPNRNLVLHTFNGLGSKFKELCATVRARDTVINFDELYDKFIEYESYFKRGEKKVELVSRLLQMQQVSLYDGAALFPPREFSAEILPITNFIKEKFAIKRFNTSKVAALKALASSASVERPTRAEVVSLLIWKCTMSAARKNIGFSRLSAMIRVVNIRKRVVPQLSKNSTRNLVGFYTA